MLWFSVAAAGNVMGKAGKGDVREGKESVQSCRNVVISLASAATYVVR